MGPRRSILALIGLFVITVTVIVGVVWVNYRIARMNIGGQEFLIYWLSSRFLVEEGKSPYSNEVADSINQFAEENTTLMGTRPLEVTAPLFFNFVTLPFAVFTEFYLARALWLTAHFALVVGLVLGGIKLTGWSPNKGLFSVVLLFILFSIPGILALLSGGLAIWSAFFIMLSFLMIRASKDEVAGLLLASAMIQPHLIVILALWVIFWAATRRRFSLIVWFFGSLLIFITIGFFILPEWVLQYLKVLWDYAAILPERTPESILKAQFPGLGSQLGYGITIISGLILLVEAWLGRGKDFSWFLWTACLFIGLSQWIGLPADPLDFIILTIPLILTCSVWEERWQGRKWWMTVLWLVLIFIGEWYLFIRHLQIGEIKPHLNLFFFLPFVIVLGLYWVRWWAIRPARLYVQDLAGRE